VIQNNIIINESTSDVNNTIQQKKEKEISDMEIDNLQTSISVKGYDQHSNSNFILPNKKFAVIKKELYLKTCPPSEKIKSKIPFLRNFNLKFTKRENIDKKTRKEIQKIPQKLFPKA